MITEPTQLPDLPLMLAGVPRAVAELLRAVGVPVEPLPAVTLLAAGSGRFVLFDSQNTRSSAQARQAARQGLSAIDLRELCPAGDWPAADTLSGRAAGGGFSANELSRAFLERLKLELERLGGVWLRVADYPFPYQSAMSVLIEHVADDLGDFTAIANSLPGRATHAVSSRLRSESLALLAGAGPVDLAWAIGPDDCESTRRGTLSHWTTRLERFRAMTLAPRGVWPQRDGLTVPRPRALSSLGFEYDCHPHAGIACRAEHVAGSPAAPPWIRCGAASLPEPADFVEWVGEHYQSGCPLFVQVPTNRPRLVSQLTALAENAGRCSLMWQTSLGEFAAWWRRRRTVRIQVWRRAAGYEIHADSSDGPATLAVELWRGNHLATFPLQRMELHVPDEGLIYLHAHKKNPAGLTLPNDAVLELLVPGSDGHRAA